MITAIRPAAGASLLFAACMVMWACGGPTASESAGSNSGAVSGAVPSPGAGASADTLCDLVTPEDWTLSGVEGAGPAQGQPDGSGGWYCVYAGASGATGGIEFDAFPASGEAEAASIYATVLEGIPTGDPPIGSAFAQSSFVSQDGVAYLAVRDGPLVMVFAAPATPDSEAGLLSLAVNVASRATTR